MEGGGHRCDHLLHVPFFSWAFKKALHILKRRRKSQWPLVLLSTDTAGAGWGWQGVIFYRLATRRLLQWYTFFFSPPSRDRLSVDVPTRVPVLPQLIFFFKERKYPRTNLLCQGWKRSTPQMVTIRCKWVFSWIGDTLLICFTAEDFKTSFCYEKLSKILLSKCLFLLLAPHFHIHGTPAATSTTMRSTYCKLSSSCC